MAYEVKSSEKTKKSGAEGETKALLYLMNFREDSNEIHYFVVDFFNDLTGMDRYSTKLWDVQSKAAKSNSAKAIGKELVTLYKNFVSSIDFESYILFLGSTLIFTILILLIHEHSIFLHLFVSPLISFISVL